MPNNLYFLKTQAALLGKRMARDRIQKLVLEDANGLRTLFYPALIPKKRGLVGEGSKNKEPLVRDMSLFSARAFIQGLPSFLNAQPRRHRRNALLAISDLIVLMSEAKNHEDAFGHAQFVAAYTLLLAKAMGIKDDDVLTGLKRGALLHDIGKLNIPAAILNKVGPLTAVEKETIKDHPLLGYRMIEGFDLLKETIEIVLNHHERFDGQGYPFGLAGEDIPLGARIFALVDALDAITSNRPYRMGRPFDEALREIEKCSRTQFDPRLTDIFLSIPKKEWTEAKLDAMNVLNLPAIH